MIKLIKASAVLTLLFYATISSATDMPKSCIGHAAKEYQLAPQLLHALYLTERGKLGGYVRNSNGSYDLGPFQINTLWLKVLGAYGIDVNMVANSAILNARIAAWRLKSEIIRAGGDVWRGVGNYRSRTPVYHNEQVIRVSGHYRKLMNKPMSDYEGGC